MRQLHDRRIPKPSHPETLSSAQMSKVLEYLMLLEEKRSRLVKGRGCAHGRPQRIYTGKLDSSSPTVMTECVFLTAVIEAKERRTVYTTDIPGAFMQGDQDEVIHMVLRSLLASQGKQ